MNTARDTSNAWLIDQVRTKARMRALTATTQLLDEEEIEAVAYLVMAGVVWTAVLVAWWAL